MNKADSGNERVNITKNVRKYAVEHAEAEAIESGLQEKSAEFLEIGAEVWVKT